MKKMVELKKTKYGDYEYKVMFDVFGFLVYVVFSEDMPKSINSRYPEIGTTDKDFGAMCCRKRGVPELHMFFELGNCSVGTLAHESWHAVRYMLLDWSKCELDNETMAYHLGWLVDQAGSFRMALIDAGLGVKSKAARGKNGNKDSQGVNA
jgi:hypothetical protein